MFGPIHHTKMNFVTCCAVEEWGHNGVKCLVEYTALRAFHVSKAMAWQKTLYGDICRELQLTLMWISQWKKKGKKQTTQRKDKCWWMNELDGRWITASLSAVIMLMWFWRVFWIIIFTKERSEWKGWGKKNFDKRCSGVQKSKHSGGHLFLLTQHVCLFFHFHSNTLVFIYDP